MSFIYGLVFLTIPIYIFTENPISQIANVTFFVFWWVALVVGYYHIPSELPLYVGTHRDAPMSLTESSRLNPLSRDR